MGSIFGLLVHYITYTIRTLAKIVNSRPRFNCGLGLLAILLSNFPIGISIRVGIFTTGLCDFVTFTESKKKHQVIYLQDLVNELSFELLV